MDGVEKKVISKFRAVREHISELTEPVHAYN